MELRHRAVMMCASLVACACGRIGFDAVPDAPDPIDLVRVPFGPARPITELNSAEDEDDVSLTSDSLEIYFASLRGGGIIFASARQSDTAAWEPAVSVPELDVAQCEVNNPGVSGNGLVIVFACLAGTSTTLWSAARTARVLPWSTPQPLDELAGSNNDGDPDPGIDGTRLYFFSSDRGPEATIWLAIRPTPQAPFDPPLPVGSLERAEGPWLDATERIAYFYRDVAGQRDLFVATRASRDDVFDTAVPLAELNTVTMDEEDPWLSPDLHTIVFAAGAANAGQRDLYFATR